MMRQTRARRRADARQTPFFGAPMTDYAARAAALLTEHRASIDRLDVTAERPDPTDLVYRRPKPERQS